MTTIHCSEKVPIYVTNITWPEKTRVRKTVIAFLHVSNEYPWANGRHEIGQSERALYFGYVIVQIMECCERQRTLMENIIPKPLLFCLSLFNDCFQNVVTDLPIKCQINLTYRAFVVCVSPLFKPVIYFCCHKLLLSLWFSCWGCFIVVVIVDHIFLIHLLKMFSKS